MKQPILTTEVDIPMTHMKKTLATLLAILLLGGACALGEEMPVVTDEPITQEESEEARKERVRQAQQMLIDLGMLNGTADGLYGPMTAQAVRLFQSRNNLVENGELNDATFEALSQKAEVAGSARQIQQRLIDLGYLRGLADGIFGERSQTALRLFQALANLPVTGEADDATREALFAENARSVPMRLTGGDKGDGVVALQEKLQQYGFLDGKADGSYGQATARAVRRFQTHLLDQGVDEVLGIAANGEATSATQALLFDPDYSSYISDLAVGDTGDEVKRVETRLNRLGYMDMPADDTYDDYAAQAAAAFREQAGLSERAVMDKETVDALFREDAPVAAAFVPHDIHKGDKGLAVEAVEAALLRGGVLAYQPSQRYNDTMEKAVQWLHDDLEASAIPDYRANAALFEDPQTLTVQAQVFLESEWLDIPNDGEDAGTLRRIQRRLNTLFYLDRAYVDGEANALTTEALQAFQTENGLPATGVADRATREVLFSDNAAYKPLPYRVEVSIEDQRVRVYERTESGDYELTQTFICSTGLGNSTPRGIFLDGFPVNRWHHFEKFDCWAQYSFVIEGDIMFHSVLFSEDDPETLRENSYYALGQKASHGCIRLKVGDARWLFNHCKRGTLAIVIY